MTGSAFGGSRLVKENTLRVDGPDFLVTGFTTDVAMNALQGKPCEFVVVEKRRFPLGAVVAIGTNGDACSCKLSAMRLFVTLFTLFRRALEVHMKQPRLHVGRLVAVDTGCCLVGSDQGEVGLRVIEASEFSP